MKKENKVVIPISLIMVKCQWWLSAVTEQISRVEKNMNSSIYKNQVQRMADDHFLRISLKKLYEWLVELGNYAEGFEDLFKKIKLLNDIKLLRNVSEHEVEYYKKNGHNQKMFLKDDYNQSIIRPLIIDGVYYIGGMININELKSILKELEIRLSNNNYNIKFKAISVLDKLMEETEI